MNDYDVRRAFERIELELIESMKRNLGRHLAEEEKEGFRWNMWQEEQLKSLKAYQRANREKFSKRFSRINEEIEDYIRSNADNAAIAEELRILRKTVDPKATIEDLMDDLDRKDADFFRVNSPKLDELLKATKKDMEKAEHAMLRKTNDQYRKIIFDSQVYANTGAGTLKQAVDMASRDFLRAGINCVEYKGGRLVNIASYAEMAIRTANQRAVLISEGDIRQQHGWHLVRISRYGGCSETCLPWQGRVYVDDVYSGGTKAEAKDTGYPLLSEAIAGGLFHPNCKHRATTFFQGMQNDHSADGKFENEPKQAEHNKCQREIQRQKRIAAGSLDEQNVQVAKNRQKQWEKKDETLNIDSATSTEYMSKFGRDERIEVNDHSKPIHIKKVENSAFDMWCDYTMSSMSGALKFSEQSLKKVQKIIGDEKLPRIILTSFSSENGLNEAAIAGYSKIHDAIFLNSKLMNDDSITKYLANGFFSTKNTLHPFLHELGHKKYYELVEKLEEKGYNTFSKQIKELLNDQDSYLFGISEYAYTSYIEGKYGEVYAEYYASRKLTNKENKALQAIDFIEEGKLSR